MKRISYLLLAMMLLLITAIPVNAITCSRANVAENHYVRYTQGRSNNTIWFEEIEAEILMRSPYVVGNTSNVFFQIQHNNAIAYIGYRANSSGTRTGHWFATNANGSTEGSGTFAVTGQVTYKDFRINNTGAGGGGSWQFFYDGVKVGDTGPIIASWRGSSARIAVWTANRKSQMWGVATNQFGVENMTYRTNVGSAAWYDGNAVFTSNASYFGGAVVSGTGHGTVFRAWDLNCA